MAAFVEAYGEEHVRFKHHQALHLEKHKRMLSCWVLERKHIGTKECLQHNRCVMHIESTGLSRMINRQLRMLDNPGWTNALLGTVKDFPEMASGLSAQKVGIARSMQWGGHDLTTNAVVFLDSAKSQLFVVVACLQIDDAFGILVRECDRVTGTKNSSTWVVDAEFTLCKLTGQRVFAVSHFRYVSVNRIEVLP